MGLIEKITKITGTESTSSGIKLIDGLTQREIVFLNSGAHISSERDLPRNKTGFLDFGRDYFKQVKPGERISPTLLVMSAHSLNLSPHCHPGGELAYVIEGEYFDADLRGNVIQRYPTGSIVAYSPFSTHRPLSECGATIFYIPFNGIIFPSRSSELIASDPEALLAKMESAGATIQSMDYARKWMFNGLDQLELHK